jgi:hypothetical protein
VTITIATVSDPDGDDNSTGTYDVTFDSSYTENGYVIAASDFTRKALVSVAPVQKGTANRLITFDPGTSSTGKLRIWTAIGTEAAGASDQATISCRVRVTGPRA